VSKRILGIVLAACLSTSVGRAAEAPFVGDWKLDAAKTRLPDAMTVQNKGGQTYAFDFGGGVETIVVDGGDQPGQDGTLLSVKTEAPDRWTVERKKDGRLVIKATWRLSKDGRTLTDQFRQFGADGSTTGVDYVYQRTGNGSGFAAAWRSVKETMTPPILMRVAPFQGDGLSFVTTPKYMARTATLDGRDNPDEGPNAVPGASSSIRRVDERTLVITRKYDGKVVATEDVGLSTDLKTLTVAQHISGRNKPNVLVFGRT
jgi:hypothetical protein